MRWQEKVERKIIRPELLPAMIATLRLEKRTIATLNGSFDILHPGHLYMISEAALTADVLILLLNSDRSIQSYKGKDRPFCPLEQRLLMVAALFEVSYVSWFEESDPRTVLEIVRPDVHVNGVEYGMDCIEADVVKRHGGRIHLVDRIGGFSTTNIIERENSIKPQ